MALRRELLPLLLAAAFLLVGPAQALATPTWLQSETRDDSFVSAANPAVAADAEGNSIAVWIGPTGQDEVRAAYRPRGGPWETTVADLEPDFQLVDNVAPHAVALTDGSFVVVWEADRNGDGDTVLRSATRSPSGEWTTEDVRDLAGETPIDGLQAGGDGSVMVIAPETGISSSNTKPSSGASWARLRTSASDRSTTSRWPRTATRSRSAPASAPSRRASAPRTGPPAGAGAVRSRWGSPTAGP